MDFQPEVLREIIGKFVGAKKLDRYEAWKLTKTVCKKYHLEDIPNNVQLLQACTKKEKERLKGILQKRPMRTLSGVAIISVATEPTKCIWSKCIYCPKGEKAPQSYIGTEPVIQRAIRKNYDSALQIADRLKQYQLMGHSSENGNKIEVIIIGGTFLGLNQQYKEQFVKGIFDGLNESISETLKEAQLKNETATHCCVNLTIETRPDFCKEEHVDEMLRYGTTRVEIGVQAIYPKVLKFINRGHTIEDVIEATRIARNAGLKINHHYMPGLPNTSFDKDLKMFKTIFEDSNFRPDYLKIYPAVVVDGTKLCDLWKKGDYQPYSTEELVQLLAEAKKFIPKYCRIQHIGREIGASEVEAGTRKTNIRQLVQWRAKELGIHCQCIRCREVGFKISEGIYPENIEMNRMDYEANNGKEIFLSFEDNEKNIILGFLRLRIPSESHRSEIDSNTALVRELKVMGSTVPVDLFPKKIQLQHRGYGKQLMKKAEEIALNEFGKKKMVVISAIGTRQYYFKLGYKRDGFYVSKNFN